MINIKLIGYNWIHNSDFYIDRPYGTDDYLFLLLRSKCILFYNGKNTIINRPAIILFPKKSAYRYSAAGEKFINDWIHFDSEPDEIKILLKKINIPLGEPIYINDYHTIEKNIISLENEFRQPSLYRNELIDAKVRVLLYKVADLINKKENIPNSIEKYENEFVNIRNEIYRLHGPDISVSDLAKKLNISTSYFHHIYKSLFNLSPCKDIIKIRIEYACTLLTSGKTPINEISQMCNYSNTEHFIRQFKQYMLYSPGEYRKIIK